MKFLKYLINSVLIIIISLFISFVISKPLFLKKNENKDQINTKTNTQQNTEIINNNENLIKEDNQKTLEKITEKNNKDFFGDKSSEKAKNLSSNECQKDSEILLVDLNINLIQLPEPIRIERLTNGNIILPEEIYKDLNLIEKNNLTKMSDCSNGYLLDKNAGFSLDYDPDTFALKIRAPIDSFAANIFARRNSEKSKPNPVLPGVYFNFQGTTTQDTKTTSFGSVIEGVGFNTLGIFSNGAIIRKSESLTSITRGDSYFRKDNPDLMETFIIGDATNNDGSWSRSAHYLGLKLSRNFLTQPGYIYTPNPIVSGSAALPSVVDVYINNKKSFSQSVNPGPFNFSHLPLSGGENNVNLIVKDVLGNEQIITQNFFTSSYFLSPGEKDFSIEGGFLRKNYGEKDFDYDYAKPFTSATYMYGITSTLSPRGRVELQKDRQALGGDLAKGLGNFGIARGTAALSNDNSNGTGALYGVNLANDGEYFSANIDVKYSDKNYTPFASNSSETKVKDTKTIGVGFPLQKISSSLNMNYVTRSYWGQDTFKSLFLSSGFSIPNIGSIGIYGTKDIGVDRAWGIGLGFRTNFSGYNFSSQTSVDPNSVRTSTYSVSNTTKGEPGDIGFSMTNENLKNNLTLATTLDTNTFTYGADFHQKDSVVDGKRLGVTGSFGWLQGESFISKPIGESSFALIKTGLYENINIYSSNSLVAKTNKSGVAVIPVRAYEKNKIEIKVEDIPFDLDILEDQTVKFATPYAKAGVFVDFPIKYSKNALVKLVQANGSPVPAGAIGRITSSNEQFVVAREGEIYLLNLSEKNHLIVTWLNIKCELDIEIEMKTKEETILGPLKCL